MVQSDFIQNHNPSQEAAAAARLAAVASSASCQNTNILRLPEVIRRVGLKRASIYLHMTQGIFPKQIHLGDRAVGWLESEIDAWLAVRVHARGDHERV